jgi:hypothetical protein
MLALVGVCMCLSVNKALSDSFGLGDVYVLQLTIFT